MPFKPSQIVKTVALCGAVSFGVGMHSLIKDAEKNPPARIIGDDGHPGINPSAKQDALIAGTVAGGTLAILAGAFGAWLKKDEEKERQTAIIAKALQNARSV